jgi:penicillin-binding protein 1A
MKAKTSRKVRSKKSYSTRINLHHHRRHKLKQLKTKHKKLQSKRAGKLPVSKPVLVSLCIAATFAMMFAVKGLQGLQEVYASLPPVETPFNLEDLATTVYDRKGVELYKLIGQEARDDVHIKDVPEHVKWAFLAAEDIDYYKHDGVDFAAILRCSINFVETNGTNICGGSTITQQLIKMTTADNRLSFDRKLREILMAQEVENYYTKQQILEQYLTMVPMGSNFYGLTTGARFYFDKDAKELTLAEAALLAAIIQNPVALSPTVGLPDPETSKPKAIQRQQYILDQLEKYMSEINEQTRINLDNPELPDILTPEMIAAARTEELKYQPPIYTSKKAGHFVDYAVKLLTKRGYNQGKPFTLTELQTGGYKVYTTLDYDIQIQLEESAAEAMARYAPIADAHNQAMVLLNPRNGEILALMGSKSYGGQSEGCDVNGQNCYFDPQMNVMDTPQSPGSSTKPFLTYEAYRQGTLFTGSFMPDVPISIGDYYPKNWNGTFHGVSSRTYAASMLCESRNLPAIVTYGMVGLPRFLQVMNEFGYSTYPLDGDYGPSVVLGGADILGIEHAQAYAVLADGGNFHRHQVITKIVDREGNTVYQHNPTSKQVADPRAVFMVNYSLLNCYGSSWDGREVAAKTGTSENSIDAWEVVYTPDLVVLGWMGNNNNVPMNGSGFGGVIVLPWIKDFMRRVGDTEYFAARTNFPQPEGLVFGGGNGQPGIAPGFMMTDKTPPSDVFTRTVTVCKDQPNRLARQIDIDTGNSMNISATYYRMPAPDWQYFLDAYLAGTGNPNGGPNQQCDVPRKATPTAPPATP